MTNIKLAAIQMSSGDDVAANCKVAEGLVERAAGEGVVLAVLPENFAGLSTDAGLRARIAETDGAGPIQDGIAKLAVRSGTWIVAGTIPLRGDNPDRPYAACCVYDDNGNRVGRYDKIHLFDVGIPGSDDSYRESANTTAGRDPVVVDAPWGRLGLAVCYDLRFPELFRHLCSEGMDILALPAAFTYQTGQAHWRTLLQARAIENLCYVVAAAQTGRHSGGRQTYGHSMILGPWGEVLEDAQESVAWVAVEADLDRLQRIRQKFPVLSHRRINAGRSSTKRRKP